jgi:Mn2+/Fe2+ NRAMP family transporter
MALSNAVMYFIILATGATLYASGHHDIENARQAAEALRPLAGDGAYVLFALGLIGTGMLGIPVLAGSAAYGVTEGLHWRGSLNDRPKRAIKFYAVLGIAVLLGLLLNYLRLDAVRMLFWAAVLNGILAPPLIGLVTKLSSDKTVMGSRTNPTILTIMGWTTTAVMGAATLLMLFLWLKDR